MNRKNRFPQFLLIGFILVLAACTSAGSSAGQNDGDYTPIDSTEPLANLNAEEIISLGSDCEAIYTRQINAWQNRETQGLRDIYTEDIVHLLKFP